MKPTSNTHSVATPHMKPTRNIQADATYTLKVDIHVTNLNMRQTSDTHSVAPQEVN